MLCESPLARSRTQPPSIRTLRRWSRHRSSRWRPGTPRCGVTGTAG